MVLLVEDNDDDVFLMKRAAAKLPRPFPMQVARDGREALDYLQGAGNYADRNAHPLPSLIFLDLKLPHLNGFEILDWINQQQFLAGIPVVILSSSSEERDRTRANALGAKKFLVKPPTPGMLKDVFDMFPTSAFGQS